MINNQLITNSCVFLIGFIGLCFNYSNILITLMGIEIILLGANLNFIVLSLYHDDLFGQIFALFVLTIAASELAIGLAILIISFKKLGTIDLHIPLFVKN